MTSISKNPLYCHSTLGPCYRSHSSPLPLTPHPRSPSKQPPKPPSLSNKTPHHHPNILNPTLPTNPTPPSHPSPPYLIFHPPNPPPGIQKQGEGGGYLQPPPSQYKIQSKPVPEVPRKRDTGKGSPRAEKLLIPVLAASRILSGLDSPGQTKASFPVKGAEGKRMLGKGPMQRARRGMVQTR
ncbi:uncharacterized protein K444DRAFT_212316 [Hyaloscypha bicolor E]|uniref:Uncharacterized protein n=1 Tax=Hyaloscypha bicolor E TaxID=1095630 RepID=A0A2J6TQ32_9HELO|nr:uncharacterized protein K444DRAFT_212316 [Hyaloscypha bicolor E]PMD65058.1 hypothetical protein K444DRAFT_212316 [Hyaloscypha bicolor E]